MWLFKRKRPVVKPVDPVVSDMKERTHKAAKEATESSDRLNQVFIQNGITLAIIRTAAGRKHGY